MHEGSGTSGRVAFQVCTNTNAQLAAEGLPQVMRYAISGGDAALLFSDELPEDNPRLGAAEATAILGDATPSLFVGVSCGLSAPYVFGSTPPLLPMMCPDLLRPHQ